MIAVSATGSRAGTRPTRNKPQPAPDPAGANVSVRRGVKDPDLGRSIGGWQGRVTSCDGATVEIAWDSLTLQAMPPRMIERCEVEGLDWSAMWLGTDEVQTAEPRDRPSDAARVKKALARQHVWAHLGPEGRRIQNE